jgi:hypothetical protein
MRARMSAALIGTLALGLPAAAQAQSVTFRYESTTVLGNGASAPVIAVFTFDAALANGTGTFGTSPTNGSYGRWSGTLRVGTESVALSGGTIEVFNNAGSTFVEDAYEFRWMRAPETASAGTLQGGPLCFFRVLLVDTDANMLSSTDLPADAAFAAQADYVQDDYQVSCGTGTVFGKAESPTSTPKRTFSLTSIGGTPAGSNVPVDSPVTLPDGGTARVSLVFDQVDVPGITSVTAAATGPGSPSGFKLTNPPVFYDVRTTAIFAGSVRVCLGWTEGQIADESQARVFHFENDSWTEITDPGSRDTVNNRVCGSTSSLSTITLMEVKYPFTGFYAPVDNRMTNAVRAGTAVPVRFSLGADLGLNIFAAGYPSSRQVMCDTGAAVDVIEETVVAGGSKLSFEAGTGRYVYVWKTESAWTGCRELVLKLVDGEEYRATFTLRK